ncbi:MAG TPA: site-specific integrase, partial [Solirubrobacteraceae bacterium]
MSRVEGRRRPVWRAKYCLPDGRQVQRTIGPAWTARGRPPRGFYTRRTAEAWLRDILEQARLGTLPGMVRTGQTFAMVAEEYLAYLAHDRQRKPLTLRDARSVLRNHLLPIFGPRQVEDISVDDVEHWARELRAKPSLANATKRKIIVIFGVMERARRTYRLPHNPVAGIEKPRSAAKTSIEVFSPEEVHALVRAAECQVDAAVFLTTAFTGLRQGELVALRWRDVEFAGAYIRVSSSYTQGQLTTPKSAKVRSVPMAQEVAQVLARLSHSRQHVGEEDLVFERVPGSYLDASALLRRYEAALGRAGLLPALRASPRRRESGRRGLLSDQATRAGPPRRERRRRTAFAVRERLSASRQLRRLT